MTLYDLLSFGTVQSRQTDFRCSDLSRSYCMFRQEKIRSDEIVQIELPIESQSDPNFTMRFNDQEHLCTCIYVCIRYDKIITNQCALLRWGKRMIAILFTIKMEDDHDFRYDTIRQYIFYTDYSDTLQLNAAQLGVCLHKDRFNQHDLEGN